MKKLATLAALAALALPVIAAEEVVTSSNVVGYQKMTLNAGYNMIGMQFQEVGGGATLAGDTMKLDDSMAGFDEDGYYATEMLIWTGSTYVTLGWSGTSGTEILEDQSLDNTWLNVDLEPTEDSLVAKDAVWIKAGSAGTILVKGEVPTTATVTVPLTAGYNMVCNPYPGTKNAVSFGTLSASMPGFDEDGYYDTEMMIWTGSTYVTLGWSGSSGTDILEDSSLDNQWLNVDLEPTEDTVPYGHGVWIKAGTAGSITFTAP